MNSMSTTMMATNNNGGQSASSEDPHDTSKLTQPILLLPSFDNNEPKTFYSQSQVPTQIPTSYGPGLLWNHSASTQSTTDDTSTFSSPADIDSSQFQLPSFMNSHLYHPIPLKQNVLSNAIMAKDPGPSEKTGNITSTIKDEFFNGQDIDYFTPEFSEKQTDPYQIKLSYDNPTQLESRYAPKKRYMNHAPVTYNQACDNRGRAVDFKQPPIVTQYTPRNPSHGSFGISSQGTMSQGSLGQSSASRGNALLLHYLTSQTSMQSEDDGVEVMKMELLFKDQVNKALNSKLTELKANYLKLKSSHEGSIDSILMPSNLHHLFKDLTRTLNERTLELEDTKSRLEAMVVGSYMAKDKNITDHGSFDAQELAHRITNKMNVLHSENEALLKMISFSNKQSLSVELNLLKSENLALKEKLKKTSENKTM